MTHKSVVNKCEALGLTLTHTSDGASEAYSATADNVEVSWKKHAASSVISGLPKVMANGRESFARDLAQISYLVRP